jgi:hypothetical protein
MPIGQHAYLQINPENTPKIAFLYASTVGERQPTFQA